MIKRHRIYFFTIILTLFSLALSNNVKIDIIEVKLNISPSRVDGREWIPFQGGSEISNKEFWQLLGNKENVAYWVDNEKEIKYSYLRPIKILIYIPLTIVGLMYNTKSEITKSYTDNFGTYQYTVAEYKWRGYLTGTPFACLSIYELYKYFRIVAMYGIKDPISYYDVKPLVEKYNEKNE